MRLPTDEALLARLDERTLSLQEGQTDLKKTQDSMSKEFIKGQDRLWEKLDDIDAKLMEKANLCPIEETRSKAHEDVESRLMTLEQKQSTTEGERKANRNWTAKVIAVTAVIISVATYIIDKVT